MVKAVRLHLLFHKLKLIMFFTLFLFFFFSFAAAARPLLPNYERLHLQQDQAHSHHLAAVLFLQLKSNHLQLANMKEYHVYVVLRKEAAAAPCSRHPFGVVCLRFVNSSPMQFASAIDVIRLYLHFEQRGEDADFASYCFSSFSPPYFPSAVHHQVKYAARLRQHLSSEATQPLFSVFRSRYLR